MALAKEDIQYIKQHLREWLAEQGESRSTVAYEIEIRERIVRVEEELQHQRSLIQQILHQMDKRFEQIDRRLERAEKSFDEIFHRLDRFMFWSLGLTVTATIFILKYLTP